MNTDSVHLAVRTTSTRRETKIEPKHVMFGIFQTAWAAAALVSFVRLAAVDRPEADFVLPPLIVEGLSDDQPWRYARLKDCELLTLCGETITSSFVAAGVRSSLFVPDDFRMTGNKPLRFILFDQRLSVAAPKPSGQKEALYSEPGVTWLSRTNVEGEIGGIVAANLFGVGDWSELWMECLGPFLKNKQPQLPDWLFEGLMGNHGALSGLGSFEKSMRLTRLKAFAWNEHEKVMAYLRASNDQHGLFPLRELFEGPQPEDAELRWRWELQASLFCRWQIYSIEGQRNGGHPFWTWARLARKGPVDESMFKRCLGLDYTEAESRMKRYLNRYLGVSHNVPIRIFPPSDPIQLRPATELEIARLLGEFQWQEAKRLRDEGDWEQALKYETAARRTYQRGLSRTKDHPQLQAGLGLLEFEGGCADEARGHLEKAFEGKADDGRALLALARLRFEEVVNTVGSDGLFNAEQIGFVLTPLFAARAELPVDIAIYRMIGEVWSRSAVIAEEKHLNVLLEGVANYPHDLELALQVAEVHVRHGHPQIARIVATRGEKLAGRSRHRAKFETLLAGLARP